MSLLVQVKEIPCLVILTTTPNKSVLCASFDAKGIDEIHDSITPKLAAQPVLGGDRQNWVDTPASLTYVCQFSCHFLLRKLGADLSPMSLSICEWSSRINFWMNEQSQGTMP